MITKASDKTGGGQQNKGPSLQQHEFLAIFQNSIILKLDLGLRRWSSEAEMNCELKNI